MKKNLLLGLMVLAGLFTSCSKDDVSSLPTDQSNVVSMKVEMPADFAKTRAVPTAPADHKLRCILEVWDKDGNNLKVRQEQIYTSGSEMTFKFDLSDQAEYKAVLWADYIATDAATSSVTTPNAYTHYADKYYKTNDATGLKKVTIIESAYTYTEQLREVFTGVKSFTKTANAIEVPKVTLKRPLTKLTIAEKDATHFALCATVKATYNVPSEFNAFTETVEAATYAATYNAAPTGTNITISSAACKALFADYVFTASDATIGEISLEFTSTGADKLTSKVIPAGIPLKRNYQINAAGSLIVSEGNPKEVSMSVDMDNNWTGTDDSEIVESITWATGNLVADGVNGAKIGEPTDKGLFFQFGSLIGWSLTDPLEIVVKPTTFNGNTDWSSPDKVYISTTIGTVPFTEVGSDNEKAGVGDPCRYYLKDTWRLPTKDEYEKLFENAGYPNGSWKWDDASKSATNSTLNLTFPASGNRLAFEAGIGEVDVAGNYWSASVPNVKINGFSLKFSNTSSSLAPSSLNPRLMGYSVRCVKDK